jgi:hypothetical protein
VTVVIGDAHRLIALALDLAHNGAEAARLERLPGVPPPVVAELCRDVADDFDRRPDHPPDDELDTVLAAYTALRQESLRQLRAVQAAGIRIRPWLRPGQPYSGSRQLSDAVRATSTLYVYLTARGHGPSGTRARRHPLLAPSGVRIEGVELCHNDVLRAVHDLFGHIAYGNSMGPAGELRAAFCQFALYPPAAHPALFAEQVSQVCWFFAGAHLRDGSGRVPARGEPGWTPPDERLYPRQKVFAGPPALLRRFTGVFGAAPRTQEER